MSRKLGKTLSLKQWMLRSDTLKLYRDIWRTTKGLQDPIQKKEIREYARSQFDEMR